MASENSYQNLIDLYGDNDPVKAMRLLAAARYLQLTGDDQYWQAITNERASFFARTSGLIRSLFSPVIDFLADTRFGKFFGLAPAHKDFFVAMVNTQTIDEQRKLICDTAAYKFDSETTTMFKALENTHKDYFTAPEENQTHAIESSTTKGPSTHGILQVEMQKTVSHTTHAQPNVTQADVDNAQNKLKNAATPEEKIDVISELVDNLASGKPVAKTSTKPSTPEIPPVSTVKAEHTETTSKAKHANGGLYGPRRPRRHRENLVEPATNAETPKRS